MYKHRTLFFKRQKIHTLLFDLYQIIESESSSIMTKIKE